MSDFIAESEIPQSSLNLNVVLDLHKYNATLALSRIFLVKIASEEQNQEFVFRQKVVLCELR
jgi:hypothetical protein